jgi:hypothetical protein
MVAYSFKPRFAEPIRSAVKRQTIRAPRRRHAIVGDRLQLFTGMRTKQCQKIMMDPVCIGTRRVLVSWSGSSLIQVCVMPIHEEPDALFGDFALSPDDFDAFAVKDGFANEADMAAFFVAEQGRQQGDFIGWLIEWEAR